MKKLFSTVLFVAGSTGILSGLQPVMAQVTISAEGKSNLTVIVPETASASVRKAAQELQTCLQLATGAELPLQKDSAVTGSAYISLGSTAQAKAAGVNTQGMADEAYRIVTKNGNLYILGPDTADGGWTKNNGASNGTAHGVYSLLEDYLGVRWLMPGDIGRDVPKQSTITLPAIDKTHTPQFSFRRITHLWDHATSAQQKTIMAWADRQKLGGSVQINYEHYWWQTLNGNKNMEPDTPEVRALYKAHPEWFAMDARGNRPLPTTKYHKLETTNQELVKFYADRAIAALKATERPITYSLSPTDGGGRWSQSPESKALYDPNPSSLFDPETTASDASMSSLVLKWYSDVAQVVAKEYPQGRLAGYLYSSYVYPPQKVSMKLPDNFTPVICGIGTYGYQLYRPDNQERWKWVMDSWAKVAPRDWYYYDLPGQVLRQYEPEVGEANFPGSTGIITPASPDIFNTIFHQLDKSRIKGGIFYGVPSWSNAALANYTIAKMHWNPRLNAEEVQKEWLQRAYGEQAGAIMEQFYIKLNHELGDYFRSNNGLSYKLTLSMLKDVYARHYPELEKLLLQAKAQPMNALQKERFQLIEDNMIVLQWRLRNAGFLQEKFASPLQRNDAQVNALLAAEHSDFARFPGATAEESVNWVAPKPLPWKVQWTAQSSDKTVAPKGLSDTQFLIYAGQEGDLRIAVESVTQGAYFASFRVTDQQGAEAVSGILNEATPIVIPAKAGQAYVLTIPSRKAVNYQLRLENAAVAAGSVDNGVLSLSGKAANASVLHLPGSNPIGVWEEGSGVVIKKPFSGAVAAKVMGDAYTNTRVLYALDNGWRFSPDPQNDGEARGVLKADFDDINWSKISPLDWWQMQGFADYHGVAWYRIKFNHDKPLPATDRARLYFGGVDGHATVYMNGKQIVERNLPADFKGWDKAFSNSISSHLRQGENVLAVKVTSKSSNTASGIFKGVAIVAGTRTTQGE